MNIKIFRPVAREMSLYIIASICFFLLFIPLWKLLQLILKYKSFHDVIDKIPGPKANFLFGNVLQFKINRRGLFSKINDGDRVMFESFL